MDLLSRIYGRIWNWNQADQIASLDLVQIDQFEYLPIAQSKVKHLIGEPIPVLVSAAAMKNRMLSFSCIETFDPGAQIVLSHERLLVPEPTHRSWSRQPRVQTCLLYIQNVYFYSNLNLTISLFRNKICDLKQREPMFESRGECLEMWLVDFRKLSLEFPHIPSIVVTVRVAIMTAISAHRCPPRCHKFCDLQTQSW